MNKEEILAITDLPILNVLIAEDVMGWEERVDFDYVDGHIARYIPNSMDVKEFSPSTDISAAWEVFTKFEFPIIEKGFDEGDNDYYICKIGNHRIIADTAPLAICRAALLAVVE